MDALRILFVEDIATDAELAIQQLKRGGITCTWRRVDSADGLRHELEDFDPQLILSDFSLPGFGGLEALDVVRECAPEVPFVFLSGTIGEERAIEALKRGAVDYVLKTNQARLVPAVKRALEHASLQSAKRQHEAQIGRLTRVLRMLSGTTAAMLRIRDRRDLLGEACRLATSIGGYASAAVSLIEPGTRTAKPAAWAEADPLYMQRLAFFIADAEERDTSVTGRVLRTAEPFVCNDVRELDPRLANSHRDLGEAGYRAIVALPLLVDHTPVGVFSLTSYDTGVIGEEELAMLRELAANLSFALQFLNKQDEVRFLSYFDPLTGLAKRTLFCQRLARMLEPRPARRGHAAVAVFDIEQLSTINDSFGRHSGDLVLQMMADRMKRHFDSTEALAHLGGGTFGLLMEVEGHEEQVLHRMQEEVASLVSSPFLLDGRSVPIEVKSGFARFPENGAEAGTLVQNAEAALRAAKSAGEKYLHHKREMSSAVVSRLNMEHRLRGALERREFELHYQPQVDISTQRIVGVEALLRWRDRESEALVSPAEFLALLESTGLIVPVGEWVMQQAAQDTKRWRAAGLQPVRTAVNISPLQLRKRAFVDQLLEAVDGWTDELWGLDIEVTEGVLVDDVTSVVAKLRTVRRSQVRVALDDFGTGYSSLSRLSALPVDTIKIDRSFTSRLTAERSGKTLVSVIIALAKTFGMGTVAEGVETREQLDALRRLGCDQSQGYLHSKPVPSADLEQMLASLHGAQLVAAAPRPTNVVSRRS
jgi:diguanylate cyclase (GGDEF)-like protein